MAESSLESTLTNASVQAIFASMQSSGKTGRSNYDEASVFERSISSVPLEKRNRIPPLPFTLYPTREKAMRKAVEKRRSDVTFRTLEEMKQHMTPSRAQIRHAYESEQKSEDWFEYRRDRITGSCFGAAAGHSPYCTPTQLLRRQLWGSFVKSRHTEHGSFYEDEAREAYILWKLLRLANIIQKDGTCSHTDCALPCAMKHETSAGDVGFLPVLDTLDKVSWYSDMPGQPIADAPESIHFNSPPKDAHALARLCGVMADQESDAASAWHDSETGVTRVPFKCWECGIMLRRDLWYIGCSPDGLVEECGEDGCLEIKCPSSKREFYVEDSRYQNTGIPAQYFDQIQGLMHFGKRKWCDFVVYVVEPHSEHRKMWIRRFYYDEVYCTQVLFPKLEHWFMKRYVPLRLAQLKGELKPESTEVPLRVRGDTLDAYIARRKQSKEKGDAQKTSTKL